MYNFLTTPLLQTAPGGYVTLPRLLANLAREEVEGYPALRPHQRPAWHMFLAQLAALALHRAESAEIPVDEVTWLFALRGLTPNFLNDEPWCLAVSDWSKPALLQPPVPNDVKLASDIPTPDALDLLITSRNHDLKQSIAVHGEPQDWLFALVSLQTGEGYGGAGNQGIARMNGGSSSRPMLGLAPRNPSAQRVMDTSPGSHFRRDLQVLLATRDKELESCSHLGFRPTGGLGLTWLFPWPESVKLLFSVL